jgi:chromate transport protein ChrA
VQLSEKAITDKLTRVLVFLGGSAGVLYNALWYYPVLMVAGGTTSILWDYRCGHVLVRAARVRIFGPQDQSSSNNEAQQAESQTELQNLSHPRHDSAPATSPSHRPPRRTPPPSANLQDTEDQAEESTERVVPVNLEFRIFSWKFGIAVVACFFASFATIIILRSALSSPPFGFRVFSNLFLAGTIIFGGGPVVIPLLQQYVVVEGWVSSRDFLLGLAIIQAFPGPNFNFAVYLGALAVGGQLNAAAGAVIGYIAIFSPGIILHSGAMGLWKELRSHRWFTSALRGINAVAVGLIYSAVYRLWEQGFLSKSFTSGSSLGRDPWWLCVTATSFVGGRWFNMSAPVAIILGGIMGMIWYGVVTA